MDRLFTGTVGLLLPKHPELVYCDTRPECCYQKFLCLGKIRNILFACRQRRPLAITYTEVIGQYCSFRRTGKERRAINRAIQTLREQVPEEGRYSCTMMLVLLERYYLEKYPEHVGMFTIYRWCTLVTGHNETFSRTLLDLVREVRTKSWQMDFYHSLTVSHIGEEVPQGALYKQLQRRKTMAPKAWVRSVIPLMQQYVEDDPTIQQSGTFFGKLPVVGPAPSSCSVL